MKKELHDLLDTCIDQATSEEKEILSELLQGIYHKQLYGVGFVSSLLQMEQTLTDDTCEITIPITPITKNSLGIVHGGITATLIDTAMGSLGNHLVAPEKAVVTTQLNVNYLSAGSGDYLTCMAKLEHRGAKTMVISSTVYRSDGKKIAHASGSFFIINKQK